MTYVEGKQQAVGCQVSTQYLSPRKNKGYSRVAVTGGAHVEPVHNAGSQQRRGAAGGGRGASWRLELLFR